MWSIPACDWTLARWNYIDRSIPFGIGDYLEVYHQSLPWSASNFRNVEKDLFILDLHGDETKAFLMVEIGNLSVMLLAILAFR